MLGMDEIGILVVYVKEILKHTKNQAGDGKNLGKRAETELAGKGDKQSCSQKSKEYPPFFTPNWYENGHQEGNYSQ